MVAPTGISVPGHAEAGAVEEAPGVAGGHRPQVLVHPLAAEDDFRPVLTVARGADALVEPLTVIHIPADDLERDGVNVQTVVNQAALEKGGQLAYGGLVQVGGKVVGRVFCAFQVGNDVGLGHLLGEEHDVGEAGVVRAGGISALRAAVIPAVTFHTAPGVGSRAGVGGLARPDGHVAGRGVHAQGSKPVIVKDGPPNDVFLLRNPLCPCLCDHSQRQADHDEDNCKP
jgi:hypothetical protein